MSNLYGSAEKADEDYIIVCVLCNSARHLQMIPHRDDGGKLVGWIFTCKNCAEKVYGSKITMEINDV